MSFICCRRGWRFLLCVKQILLLLLRALLLDLQARLGVLLDDLKLGVGRQQRPGSGILPPVLAPPASLQRRRPAGSVLQVLHLLQLHQIVHHRTGVGLLVVHRVHDLALLPGAA